MFSFFRSRSAGVSTPMKRLALLLVLSLLPTAVPLRAAEYQVQPEDTLEIRVSGEPELSKPYKVDEAGDILVDMLGKVRVAGLTQKEVQEKLTEGLKKYLKVFEVTVGLSGEPTGNRVAVYGEVRRPGQIKVRQGSRLLDVLAEAGGLGENANGKQVTISRKGGGKTETLDADAALRNPELNVEIRAGDTITIPSRISQTVTVDGEVMNPGEKPIETARTAFDAIMKAGPKPSVDWTRVVIRRKGSSLPLVVDLSKVRTGALKDDLELQEGDRITLQSKFSGMATVGGEVMNPGEKELNGQVQIQEFLRGEGGGLKESADKRRIQVIRGGKDPVIIDLSAIERGERRSDDPALEVRPGDRIFVPLSVATLAGQVKNQGPKTLGDTTSVYDFVNSAGGGLTEKADPSKVQIWRDGKILRTVDLTRVSSGQVAADDPDLQLEPGDKIFVPDDSASRFVIVGGVQKPGEYRARPGMTLLDAIAAAENFSPTFNGKKIVIAPRERFTEDGKFKTPDGDVLDDEARNADAKKEDEESEPAREGDKDKEKPKERKKRPGKGKRPSVEDDPEAYGMRVVDYKKLANGDLTLNYPIRPGDRILVPMKPAQDDRQQFGGGGGGIFRGLLRMLFWSPF